MTLFSLSPVLLRGLSSTVWLAVLVVLALRRSAWQASSSALRLMLAGVAVIGGGFLIGAAFTLLNRTALTPERVAIEAVGLIAGGFVLAGLLRYRHELRDPEAPVAGAARASGPDGARLVGEAAERARGGVMVVSIDGGAAGAGPVVYANPVARAWLGQALEDGGPPTLAAVFAAGGRGGLWPIVAAGLAQGRPTCEALSLPDGNPDHPVLARLTLVPVGRAEGGGPEDAAHDACLALALLEKGDGEAGTLEQFQSESEAAVTRLAAGLAHDFSNVLTVILTASEILLMDETLPPELRRRIERMHSAAQRGADLTEQLRAFAGRLDLMEEMVDLHGLLRDSAVEFKTILGPGIELHYDLADGDCPVMLDPERMRAALRTVLAYYRAVMCTAGGRVELSTRLPDADGAGAPLSGSVVLSLTRTDSQVPLEQARRMLEQPYSLGASSIAGGGFGLSLVAAFVRQSGGQARFVGRPGGGPVLEMELPLAANTPVP